MSGSGRYNNDTVRHQALCVSEAVSHVPLRSTHTHTNEIRSTLYVNLKIRMLSCFAEVGLLQKLLRRATVYNRPSSI